jgi:hypothetical protein
MAMGRVKRTIAEHVLGFFGDVAAGDVVDVLVVAAGEMDVVKSAVWFVDALVGLELWDVAVGVGHEEFHNEGSADSPVVRGLKVVRRCY